MSASALSAHHPLVWVGMALVGLWLIPRLFRLWRGGGAWANPPQEEFCPWADDFWKAGWFCCLGFGWVALVLFYDSAILAALRYPEHGLYVLWGLAMLCALPLWLGASYFECGRSRKRGKDIETRAKIAVAVVLPDGWTILSDMRLPTGEDIDLPIRLHDGDTVVVEIKSWNYWSGFVRKRKAIAQVRRQRKALGAFYGVIWLPKARHRYVGLHDGALVVGGNRRSLVREIQGVIVQRVVIKFPKMPSDSLRRQIKSLGFVWYPASRIWTGLCSGNDLAKLIPGITAEGGTIQTSGRYSEVCLDRPSDEGFQTDANK